MSKNTRSLLYWGILAALGVFIIVAHNTALNIVCKVIAVALILTAAAGIISWFRDRRYAPEAITRLVGCLLFLGFGLWMLLSTDAFISVVNVIIGAVMIISGITGLIRGIRLGASKVVMTISVIGIVLGIIIAAHNAATTWFTICEGIGLVYSAVVGFITDRQTAAKA